MVVQMKPCHFVASVRAQTASSANLDRGAPTHRFVEAFCPASGAFPSWVCPAHSSREACCLDQLLSIKEHASLGVPLMIHTEAIDEQADEFQVACFLIAAQKWSYVVRLPSPPLSGISAPSLTGCGVR